ncbi:hypothetical protein BD779DRAFT_1474620 [Infundibulicybe gibba]|nr:hypothetical protein BD779DRAFT_1474620 [Infundibulicybe gibba]
MLLGSGRAIEPFAKSNWLCNPARIQLQRAILTKYFQQLFAGVQGCQGYHYVGYFHQLTGLGHVFGLFDKKRSSVRCFRIFGYLEDEPFFPPQFAPPVHETPEGTTVDGSGCDRRKPSSTCIIGVEKEWVSEGAYSPVVGPRSNPLKLNEDGAFTRVIQSPELDYEEQICNSILAGSFLNSQRVACLENYVGPAVYYTASSRSRGV